MIEQQLFRGVMASICTPVAVVTTCVDGDPRGATVGSFASLSVEPPLIGVAFDRGSALLGHVCQVGRFGVNLLGHAQDELAITFSRRGVDRFAEAVWHVEDGLPRLADAAGWLVCDLYRTVGAGDHLLLFGLVRAASRTDRAPLVYARHTFGTHSRFAERPRSPITDTIAACAR